MSHTITSTSTLTISIIRNDNNSSTNNSSNNNENNNNNNKSNNIMGSMAYCILRNI